MLSDSSSRCRSDRARVHRTVSQERVHSASASIVDPACPLPIDRAQEAASDYLHYNVPLISTSECKTFKLNCELYIDKGAIEARRTFDI